MCAASAIYGFGNHPIERIRRSCWKHQKILEWDLVAVVEWDFRWVKKGAGRSIETWRTGNAVYLTIDEFRQIFVEYQGDEPVPILINSDRSGLEGLRKNVAALY